MACHHVQPHGQRLGDEERRDYEVRIESLNKQRAQAIGETLGLKEEIRHMKAAKAEMEVRVIGRCCQRIDT